MNSRRVLTWTVIAQIILIHAVEDVVHTSGGSDFFQPGEEFVFAVKTPVRIVGDVFRVVELVGLNVLVENAGLASERLCIVFVRCGNGGRISSNRNRLVAEYLGCRPGQICG